jgi:hypothetical protein
MMMKTVMTTVIRLAVPLLLTGALVLTAAPRPASADENWQFGFAAPTPQQVADAAMGSFRSSAVEANNEGFVGAFPNFFTAWYGPAFVAGTVFVGTNVAQWRDVPLAELGNPALGDFGARMRAVNVYASQHGYVAAFPNFFHADYGHGIVCGTVLLNGPGVEWRDVPLSELGNPSLDDIGARFRATNAWATQHGYVGGFPNFFHADYGHGIVCGTVLLKLGYAQWHDVTLSVLR